MNIRILSTVQMAQWGRFRSVVDVLGDGEERISLAVHGKPGEDGTMKGELLFQPATLERLVLLADKCIEGDPQAIAHPKTILMLATALVAIVETINQANGGDDGQ